MIIIIIIIIVIIIQCKQKTDDGVKSEAVYGRIEKCIQKRLSRRGREAADARLRDGPPPYACLIGWQTGLDKWGSSKMHINLP